MSRLGVILDGISRDPEHALGVAREAGLGILTLEERRENWRTAMLRLKGLVDPYGIAFPAIPEIGIDGETVPFDPDDIMNPGKVV